MSAIIGLSLLRDELSLSSWLTIGATLQVFISLLLPLRYAVAPVLGLGIYKLTNLVLQLLNLRSFKPEPGVIQGRFSAMMPPDIISGSTYNSHEKQEGDVEIQSRNEGITVFLLGFQSSHPLGKFGPGIKELQSYAQKMFTACEKNRSTNGYLGRGKPMLTADSNRSNALLTLTYWRSIEDLQRFTLSESHMEGWKWYDGLKGKYPHMGIAHEVYECPKGNWENIYHNFRKFGMGTTKYVVETDDGDKRVVGAELVTGGKKMKSMFSRMGKAKAEAEQ